nr:hypothetical protein [Candidatus Sigynarchaeota archaeon]
MEEIWYNLLLMGLSYVYGLSVIAVGVVLQKRMNKDSSFTRKVIHVFAGYTGFVTFWFTPSYSWLAIIIGASFTLLLYLARPEGPLHKVFDSMARGEDQQSKALKGPLYYAISLTILVAAFSNPLLSFLLPFFWIPACCLSMMFLGDGIAPMIGKRWGKHPFGKAGRTVEGTLGVFLFGCFGSIVTYVIAWSSPTQVTLGNTLVIVLVLLVVSGLNALIEAFSPAGLDNLTCPFIATTILSAVIIIILNVP